LQKTDATKPWGSLDLVISNASHDLFNASVVIFVGARTSRPFWEDAWIRGLMADTIAPMLMKHVRPGIRRVRTVADGSGPALGRAIFLES
jgi:hypothetical protein